MHPIAINFPICVLYKDKHYLTVVFVNTAVLKRLILQWKLSQWAIVPKLEQVITVT